MDMEPRATDTQIPAWWLPTGDRSFGTNATKCCPACRQDKDHEHLLRCDATVSKINARLQLQILRRSLKTIHVLPSTWAVIESELQYEMGLVDEKPSQNFLSDKVDNYLRRAWVDQLNIGWTNMIMHHRSVVRSFSLGDDSQSNAMSIPGH